MRRLFTTAAIAVAMITSAQAESLIAQKLKTGSEGQPLCANIDKLKEYMLAALVNDAVALRAIHKEGDCSMVKAGVAVSVLEEFTANSDTLYPVKIRVMNQKGGSVVGYSMNVGLIERK
jgi:hypothetical protein